MLSSDCDIIIKNGARLCMIDVDLPEDPVSDEKTHTTCKSR